VNGRTLDNAPAMSLPQQVQVFVAVASGLVHMHRKGVCHADLKPGNILGSRARDVKIIDFGLAWIKGQQKGRIQGTPEYMAPETATLKPINERTDIYNFGATMYRMVTGQLAPSVIEEETHSPIDITAYNQLFKRVHDLNEKVPAQLADL